MGDSFRVVAMDLLARDLTALGPCPGGAGAEGGRESWWGRSRVRKHPERALPGRVSTWVCRWHGDFGKVRQHASEAWGKLHWMTANTPPLHKPAPESTDLDHAGPHLPCREGIDVDRRREPTAPFSRYVWFGGRRTSGGEGTFVDRHGGGLFALLLAVVLLNVLDAGFTVYFLSYGGEEVNPVMNWVLGFGVGAFLFAKSAAIGGGVVVLAWAKNFRPARIGLAIVLLGYTALLMWHLTLYSWLHLS